MSAIVGCKHYVNGKQVPCPPMCPCQSWPDRPKLSLLERLVMWPHRHRWERVRWATEPGMRGPHLFTAHEGGAYERCARCLKRKTR